MSAMARSAKRGRITACLSDSDRFKQQFNQTLSDLRVESGFRIVGYVLMPELFHLLLWPSEKANPSQILQKLEGRMAECIPRTSRANLQHPWCAKMLARPRLPPSVHDEAHYRVWERRFYDMNVWTEMKRLEKLTYRHNHPMKRGLAKEPGDGLWSRRQSGSSPDAARGVFEDRWRGSASRGGVRRGGACPAQRRAQQAAPLRMESGGWPRSWESHSEILRMSAPTRISFSSMRS
jgi:REP element-mobilizing transposase RayT